MKVPTNGNGGEGKRGVWYPKTALESQLSKPWMTIYLVLINNWCLISSNFFSVLHLISINSYKSAHFFHLFFLCQRLFKKFDSPRVRGRNKNLLSMNNFVNYVGAIYCCSVKKVLFSFYSENALFNNSLSKTINLFNLLPHLY